MRRVWRSAYFPLPDFGMEISMKNQAAALIFHTSVCAGASQTALIAEEKSPARIFLRVPSRKTLQNGDLYEQNIILGMQLRDKR